MAKIGPKEAATRALREQKAVECRIDHDDPTPGTVSKDMCAVCTPRKRGTPRSEKRREGGDPGVTLAPPIAIQQAIAKDFADEQSTAPVQSEEQAPQPQQETDAMTTKRSKKAATAKARSGKSKTPKTGKKSKIGAPREGSKLAIVGKLLARPEGCTTQDVLKATGWPSVSLPQQAKALGVTLKKEKDGNVTRYRAA